MKLNIQLFANPKLVIETDLNDQGFSKGLNKIKSLAKTGFKAVGTAVGAASAAIVALGKQSLDAYADYEQLVGGVDTLFKESSKTIQKYASEAYKTAGLSANQYMETVTSFSASLLQSLGNDTKKAADYSNRAVTDMSDNANKMGTDMSLIQSAYQGFAKQNYTMLDNLKLGYGGTKTEMERLVSDASNMKKEMKELGVTVDEDSLSFGNIVNAISVMQKHMGIAGTTADEAEKTISGSVNAMKGAWTNLVVGLADDTADFDKLIDNFVDSIETVGENILPRVEIILNGIVDLVAKLGDKIIEALPGVLEKILPPLLSGATNLVNQLVKIFPQILKLIQDNLPTIVKGALSVVEAFIKTVLSMLPDILDTGIKLLMELVKGIVQMLPELIPVAIDTILTFYETLIDNLDLIIDASIELIIALTDGLINSLPILIKKVPIIIDKLVTKLTDPDMIAKIIQAAGLLIAKLAIGLIESLPQMAKATKSIVDSLIKGLSNALSSMKNVGKNLIAGLWQGIQDKWNSLKNKVSDLGNGIVNKFKSVFEIHSPSRLFRDEIGKQLIAGVGVGFEDGIDDVYKDMQKAIDLETSKMSANVQASGTYQMAMAGLPQFNLLDNTENTTQLVVNGKVLAEVVNTENRNREVASA